VEKTNTLFVDLGDRSYPIFIGEGLLGSSELLAPYIHGDQLFIVTNEVIAPLYLELLVEKLSLHHTVETLILPDGETYKNLEILNTIFDALLLKKFNRSATLLALGGGVIGDMTGFAAACYQRGVNFIQIPTTLLAQVDSSVGGKTAVNHKLGKNMIGAFYQPECVMVDISLLKTLPDREFKAGLAEVIKYGLIADVEFFYWIEKNIDQLLARDPDSLCIAIEKSCSNKAKIVSRDERENDIRAILNLGHTFGHAIETFFSYKGWLHGEAISVGMTMAAKLSSELGSIETADYIRIKDLLVRCELPVSKPDEMTSGIFLELMSVDKKVIDGNLRLVLLESIGKAVVTSNIERDILIKVL
jgi:3-dehydroquinate synthase